MGNLTIAELQIELGKLGIENMVWSVLHGNHCVSFVSDERRASGFGKDLVSALKDALNKFTSDLGADVVIERFKESR